ncbi:MAG: ATP-binding cassette domain-containing protein [Candidatus Cloacimonetes bacterium]|jgi:ABC-type lipoprotein export system ATPase subunit|nr:ATP-binding cassette domain-containing protein [Candidatus Cloacimonadota bacterium]MBT4332099.1 ATP-binding cassette domain-containing protein [Candidatus Cloacimonadota bacterium]MBT4575961.1 ATP-binding cassette domain-containing protein [Candidatus Cloacimonadota bacterium]MBT5419968.1 ATP-binding cassette domain-containing protein [Candidatus Cloacimonadota bacterium]
MKKSELIKKQISQLLADFPFLQAFFNDNNLEIEGKEALTLPQYFDTFDEDEIEDRAIDAENLISQIGEFIEQMIAFLGKDEDVVKTVSILPGTDKSGNAEKFDELVIKQGEIISIVGPTGSGKSRLLGDIEWVAQNDTPTSRKILINNDIPDKKWRFSSSDKLVAQLSQNMNFVMDLSVYEFVELHAESRLVENKEIIIKRIIDKANDLAGEKFSPDTPITSLSGGQSRALMIADTAILSKSPIILIDEIENAGIDRKRALRLLLSEDKIVLMATHDPILALMGTKRIVIKNGGIHKVIETTDQEREILTELEELDKTLLSYRTKLRLGEIIKKI